MCYISKLECIPYHNAKNKTQSKQTSVSMHSHTHTHTYTHTHTHTHTHAPPPTHTHIHTHTRHTHTTPPPPPPPANHLMTESRYSCLWINQKGVYHVTTKSRYPGLCLFHVCSLILMGLYSISIKVLIIWWQKAGTLVCISQKGVDHLMTESRYSCLHQPERCWSSDGRKQVLLSASARKVLIIWWQKAGTPVSISQKGVDHLMAESRYSCQHQPERCWSSDGRKQVLLSASARKVLIIWWQKAGTPVSISQKGVDHLMAESRYSCQHQPERCWSSDGRKQVLLSASARKVLIIWWQKAGTPVSISQKGVDHLMAESRYSCQHQPERCWSSDDRKQVLLSASARKVLIIWWQKAGTPVCISQKGVDHLMTESRYSCLHQPERCWSSDDKKQVLLSLFYVVVWCWWGCTTSASTRKVLTTWWPNQAPCLS